MSRNSPFLLILITSLIFLSHIAYAQTGTIQGVVSDKNTGETIIGANVIIVGTTTGTSTDLNGEFKLNVPASILSVSISFISYEPVIIDNVKVEPGKVTFLNVSLEEVSTAIEGIEIVARRVTHTEMSLISAIKASNVVVSGISAQQISRSQDTDAAAVVKRIPGVTIVDNRFIMIRGLAERYNPTFLHSIPAPSMETDIKSFSFDIIPSNLIDRIIIFKSPSPELPGEFAGGVVKIFPKTITDENFLTLTYSSGYDESSSFNTFYEQTQGNNHWLGINDKINSLPANFPDNLRTLGSDPVRIQEAGRELNNNWVPNEVNAGLNHSFALFGGYRFRIGELEIGNVSSITYGASKSIDNVLRLDYNAYNFDLDKSSILFRFNDQKNSGKIRSGFMHNWSFNYGRNHKIEFINLFNQLNQTDYTFRTGPNFDFDFYANNHDFYQKYRGIYSGQIIGNHEFFDQKTAISWTLGLGKSFMEEPDYRRYRSDLDTVSNELTLYIPTGAAATYFMGRFYSELEETIRTGRMDITQRFTFPNSPNFIPELSIGAYYETKDRTFDGRNLGYVRSSSFQFDQDLIYVAIDSLFHPDNINPTTGIKIDEQTNPSDSYSGGSKILAGYAMVKIPISRKITLTGGIRIEDNVYRLKSFSLTGDPVNVNNPTLDILPSANLSYNFTERMLVRVAYGKTLNRPEFRELAPFGFYDFNYNRTLVGNTSLVSADISNYEMRWEFYPSVGEMISLGVFYKEFNNPIEFQFRDGGGSGGIKSFMPVNGNAFSLGTEMEIRKSLEGMFNSSFLDKLTVLFNGAFIKSEISGVGLRKRPMMGQSPYVFNTGLYFRDVEKRLQINLLHNIIGKRIMVIGTSYIPDTYEMPRHLVDLTLTKGFGRNFELKVGVRDLLKPAYILLQDANEDGVFDKENDQIIEKYTPGTIFSVGISYKI
jgi:outer membrane receptor for ferrienterochelin and colicin